MSRALVGARERWKSGVLASSALVGARQRWWAMIQVVLQLPFGLSRVRIRASRSELNGSAKFWNRTGGRKLTGLDLALTLSRPAKGLLV